MRTNSFHVVAYHGKYRYFLSEHDIRQDAMDCARHELVKLQGEYERRRKGHKGFKPGVAVLQVITTYPEMKL